MTTGLIYNAPPFTISGSATVKNCYWFVSLKCSYCRNRKSSLCVETYIFLKKCKGENSGCLTVRLVMYVCRINGDERIMGGHVKCWQEAAGDQMDRFLCLNISNCNHARFQSKNVRGGGLKPDYIASLFTLYATYRPQACWKIFAFRRLGVYVLTCGHEVRKQF